MTRNSEIARAVRRSLVTSAVAAVAATSLPAVTQAQDQTDQDATGGPVQTVTVTGSRIPLPNLTSISPVTTVSAEEIKLTGVTRVEDLINNLPQAFADFGGNLSNGSTGAATVNLRNLGSQRTLVLVNGRRLMPGDPTQNGAASPDLNQIPAALVQRIEVLTGGASAVYGADAVAGVVNFIMNDKFEGIRFDGQYSFNQHNNDNDYVQGLLAGRGFPSPGSSVTDGDTKEATFMAGINTPDGEGNATVYVGWRKLNAVTQDQRDFSSCSLGSSPAGNVNNRNFTCAGSGTTSPAQIGTYDPSTVFTGTPESFLNNADNTWAVGPGGVLNPFTAADQYNFAPLNYFQRPDERKTAGLFVHYNVNDAVKPYGEFQFMDDRTEAQIAGSGAFLGGGPGGPPFFGRYLVNCDNPYLSADELAKMCNGATVGNTLVDIGKRNVEGGGRIDDLRHTSFRAVVGSKGDFGASGWSYDAYAQYGSTILAENYLNDVSRTRMGKALLAKVDGSGNTVCAVNADADPSNDDPTCVPYNIWTPGGVTADAVNYLQVPGFTEGSTVEEVASGSISGDLGQHGVKTPWAEDGLGVAFGAEWRSESSDLRADSSFQTNDLAGQGAATLNTNGSFTVREIFTEARLPIMQDRPGAKILSVEAGYRYSDYSLGFTTDTYKAGADWAPTEDVRFRGSYQRAVRAPNIQELFLQQRVQLDGASDPCSFDPLGETADDRLPTASLAECANTGVTSTQYGNILGNPAAQYNGLVGGNPNLKPETSDTVSFGFVLTPRFVENLSVSVDYYDIKVEDLIGQIGADLILQNCLDSGDPTYCTLVHRAANGSLWLGDQGYVIDPIVNTGSERVKGIDFEANYRMEIGSLGRLGINFVGNYVDSLDIEPLTGAPHYDCVGLYGPTCGVSTPKWSHKARVAWTTPWNIDLSATWRFKDKVQIETTSSDPGISGGVRQSDKVLGKANYLDLAGSYTYNKITARVGVNNVFDKDPPLIGANSVPSVLGSGNTLPQVYDALGRYIFFGLTADF